MRSLLKLFWSLRYQLYSRDVTRPLREGKGTKEGPLELIDIEPLMKMLRRLEP